jgi:hypothetical protein
VNRLLPLLACLLVAGVARAQEQEKGMLARIESARPDSKMVNPMQTQAFSTAGFSTKAFGASEYGGVKSAGIKTFETRSFFGLKNPWFGRKVFETSAENLGKREARESREKYKTDVYAVQEFAKAGKPDLVDAATVAPSAAQPRPYLIPGKTQSGVDKFTQNLQMELTIEDVRDLLNKGRGE